VASIAGNFVLGSAAGTTRTIGATAQNNLQLGDTNTGGIALSPDGTTALYAQTGGNVGIGTTNPATKLDVSGKIALDGTVIAYRPTTMTSTLILGDGGTALSHTAGIEGYYNTFVGLGSGTSNTTGYNNTANGMNSLNSNTTGFSNTAIGMNSLRSNTTGFSNTALGFQAGYSFTALQTMNNSTFIGYGATSSVDGVSNSMALGYQAQVTASNQVVIGNDSVTQTLLKGNVGVGTADSPTGVNPTAKLQVYSTLGTTPAASISGKTSAPGLLVTNDGSGDLIVASASGQTMFRLTNAGNLLLPAGSKVTGPTLYDPLYDIDGIGYSTFLPAMPGVKEEVAGRINTSYDSTLRAYAKIINLDNQPIGSDLWVFSRTIDRDINLISALLTPDSSARTWYVKDPTTRSLIVYSDRPTEVSYRFTAPRFDHMKYPTNVNNEEPAEYRYHTPAMPDNINTGPVQVTEDTYWTTLNIILNNEAWSLVDSFNNEFVRVEAFSKAKIAELTAGLINAQKVTTGSLAVATNSVTIAGQSLQSYIEQTVTQILNSQFSILNSGNIVSPLASIDQIHTNIISPLGTDTVEVAGSLKVNGNVHADGVTAGSATVSGNLTAKTVNSEQISTNEASISGALTANTVNSEQLTVNGSATVSGTLAVGRIVADSISANSIEGLDDRIQRIASSSVAFSSSSSAQNNYALNTNQLAPQTNTLVSSESANLDIASISNSQLSTLNSQFLDIQSISSGFGTFRDGLIALGPATFNQITAIDSLSIGTNLTIGSNSINLLGEDLQIQPLKQGGISFLAGLVHIDTQGNLAVGGNADFAKDVTVHGNLAANIISPLADKDLALNLPSSPIHDSSFVIHNSSQSAVLAVNQAGDIVASGSGTFNKLNFALVAPAYALDDTTAIATSSAGTATLKQFKRELTIKNSLVTDKSLIYITPVGDTSNQVLYLLRQVAGESFTVGVSTPAAKDVNFNWMIVN
ncbi:MAG: hypothetical protein COX79_01605, partial [Candidatus Levybacteria bacterium CG_4_10_14_0_2_um_filter_36_16]